MPVNILSQKHGLVEKHRINSYYHWPASHIVHFCHDLFDKFSQLMVQISVKSYPVIWVCHRCVKQGNLRCHQSMEGRLASGTRFIPLLSARERNVLAVTLLLTGSREVLDKRRCSVTVSLMFHAVDQCLQLITLHCPKSQKVQSIVRSVWDLG